MDEKPIRNLGQQVLLTAFAFVLVIFVTLSALLVYQNFELARRIDTLISSQAEINAQVQQLQREVIRLNSFFEPGGVKKMSLRLKESGGLADCKANYYAALIYGHARKNGLDPFLVYSVIKTESHFTSAAVSSKGARGLMQVMPAWTRTFAITPDDLLHPAVNISVGTSILGYELARTGDVGSALAVYYSGQPRENDGYVRKVMNTYKRLRTG
jgi:soluble lytic murein transglycosylase-like protein